MALMSEVGALRKRLSRRPAVAQAVVAIMRTEGIDEAAAFRRLREIAMESRRTIEDAAEAVVARSGSGNDARDSA
jgi:AmiR/NasT family two-component response regulator